MPDNIFYLIKKLDKTILKHMAPPEDKRLNPTQILFINYILDHQNEDIYQKDIEKNFKLSRAAVSDILGRMEKKKLITRQKNEKDIRSKKIYLTSQAKDFFNEGKEKIDLLEQKALKNISNTELENFKQTIDKLIQNINE